MAKELIDTSAKEYGSPASKKKHREVIIALRNARVFKSLSENEISKLSSGCQVHHYPKGSIIFFQYDPAAHLYVLRSGLVGILLTSSDGRQMLIHEIAPGEVFGELALVARSPRSTTALALESSDVLIISIEMVLPLLQKHIEMTNDLLQLIAQRLYQSNQRESALAFLDAPARLARILRILDQQSADKGYISTSQEELARRTGLTRQTVAKNLSRWRRSGWLLTGRGKIVVLDLPALENVEGQMLG